MMTGSEHTREAERLAASAETWMDADHGWRAEMSTQERILRRSVDLQAAQVHATLAQTAAANEYIPLMRQALAELAPHAEATAEATAEEGAS
ncbi:MAG TPA: hypothetical protein VGS62_10775 [Streptosporangiaceae bacterium]|nr:hypothetical protein [Streptosporangiaceae bacterium]